MGRYAIIDKATGKVLNVIEAEPQFFKANSAILDIEGKVVDLDKVEYVESQTASAGDIVVEGVVYRRVEEV